MKKLLFMCLLTLGSLSNGSPRCLDHQTSKFKSPLRKSPLEIVECNCPCQNYPRSHHADGYKCLVCEHKLIPMPLETSSTVNTQPSTNAAIASTLVASSQKLYHELKQPKPIATPQKPTEESWMIF